MAAENLPPPFIYTPNLANLRDAGGLTISDSNSVVKTKYIYRSADPSLCTKEEIRFFHEELGIEHIFDLRSGPEFERQGTEVVAEFDERIAAYNSKGNGKTKIQRYWTPVFKTEDYSPESIALRFREYGAEDSDGFMRAYTEILLHGGPSYAKILKQMGQVGSGAVLLHCTAGKDRTGVLVAIILTLLGVPRTVICQEYQLTETGLAHRRPFLLEKLMASGAFEGEQGREAALRMSGSRAESMQRTLEMIDKRWGGAEGYVKEVCGLSDSDIAALRKNLIVPANEAQGGRGGAAAILAQRAVL
jgi:protein tyrosine/serine phosphatase